MSKLKNGGDCVKELRKSLGLTQVEFAEKIEIASGNSYISQIENNKVGISLSQFIEWLDKLNVKTFDLIE